MVSRGYLSQAEAEAYRLDALKREPAQINVLEMSHELEYNDDVYKDGIPFSRIGGIHLHTTEQQRSSLLVASLYSVSGQVWQKNAAPSFRLLPWEFEPQRRNQRLDRRIYRVVFEWGRSAQEKSREIEPLYARMAMVNYLDLKAHGGRLEDAYVTVHARDEKHSRLFLKMHPGSIYPKGWTDMKDTILVIPLLEALTKYPARLASAEVGRLIELSGNKLTDLQALDILIGARLTSWNELDFTSLNGPQSSPIILFDLSGARIGLLHLALMRAGIDRDKCLPILEYLAQILNRLHTSDAGSKYQNAADSLLTGLHYAKSNAIEISNLDPAMAKRDPYYSVSVLMAAFSYYIGTMRDSLMTTYGLSEIDAYLEAAKALKLNPIQFGITTSDPTIEQQIAMLNPSSRTEQRGTVIVDGSAPSSEINKPYWYRDSRQYFFTAEEIRRLSLRHAPLYEAVYRGLREGHWRSHYLQSQTDFF